MRVALLVALLVAPLLLAACAAQKLALAPPPGVDFSGRWKLNEADSDDPQRLVLSQLGGSGAGAGGSGDGGQGGRGGQGGSGGRGGRGGGQGGRGGGVGPSGGAPSLPAVGALSEGLRWPGKELEIKQVAGVVAVTSVGESRLYQPLGDAAPRRRPPKDDAGPRDRDRSMRARGSGPPPKCGWDDGTLVVQTGDPDDDYPPFVERYSLGANGQRLIEVVGFKGGRGGGFTMSRVWDRVP